MATKTTDPALADPDAREFLHQADPVLARIIDARPDFRPRAWTQDLPALDAFSTLIFQVLGQQLSVRATRTILGRLEQLFGGRLPTPAEMLAADPDAVRSSGMSARKAATLRAVAQRFVDGSLSDEALSGMSDDEVVAALTSIPGIGPWTAHGFLLVALDRPDVFLTGDIALRRAIVRAYGLDHLPTDDEMLAARRTLATVSEPGRQLPVRVRIRRTRERASLRRTNARLRRTNARPQPDVGRNGDRSCTTRGMVRRWSVASSPSSTMSGCSSRIAATSWLTPMAPS